MSWMLSTLLKSSSMTICPMVWSHGEHNVPKWACLRDLVHYFDEIPSNLQLVRGQTAEIDAESFCSEFIRSWFIISWKSAMVSVKCKLSVYEYIYSFNDLKL